MNNFKRILDLVRRTGDKLVVTDPDGEQAFVVMDLDEYEILLEENGLIEPYCGDEDMFGDFKPDDLDEDFLFDDVVESEVESELDQEFAPEPPPELLDQLGADPVKEESDLDAKINANLSEDQPKKSDDEPDEQFYLEPVE
jgi:hypothetical protein